MTYTISLSPTAEKRLHERATAYGQEVTACLNQLIEEALAAKPSVDQVLAPIRRQFQESGMTEEELDALVEEVREEIWQEQQARKAP
jgi:hypothetical protein